MLNIVIPMAGRGSRFANQGYTTPKPFIPVHGVPMIELVVSNLRPTREHRFLFVCLAEHIAEYRFDERLEQIAPGCELIVVDSVTEGAACTVLLARDFIDNRDALMIANSDQWVDFEIDRYMEAQDPPNVDALIMVMHGEGNKWSYVRFGSEGEVTGVVEKQPVSDKATVGIYNFAHGADFVAAADEMIRRELRVNGEFYVAPAYDQIVEAGKHVAIFEVGAVDNGMYGLGTPEDLERFLQMEISHRAARAASAASRRSR